MAGLRNRQSIPQPGMKPSVTDHQRPQAPGPGSLHPRLRDQLASVPGIEVMGEAGLGKLIAEVDRAYHEADLRQQHLETALNHAVRGVLMVDASGAVVAWNDHLVEIMKPRPGLLEVGKPLAETVSAFIAELGLCDVAESTHREIWQGFMQAEAPMTLELPSPHGRTIEIHVTPLNGRGFVASLADVTEQKALETSLRTARETAEEASRLKSEFLANMSHELRTPLNAIIGFSEILAADTSEAVPANHHGYAQDIRDSGHHLLCLINDLLDLSKIEAGKFELNEDQVNLPGIIGACIRMVTPSAEARQITLSYETGQIPPLHADERALRQIFLNALSNAVKFTNSGGRIDVHAGPDAGGGIIVTVADNGIGMAAEDIPRAIRPFEQVGRDRMTGQPGTGLGLPLIRSLTELHGGTFEIDSALGEGTTLSISLPRERTRPGYVPKGRAAAV